MSVASELALRAQRLEYFVCIEGISWPVNDLHGSLSGGFDGTVWTTDDFDGDLATQLDCTVLKGLGVPSTISESVDPRTGEYKPSGLTLEIVDGTGWWVSNFTPRKPAAASTTINTQLEYAAVDVVLADGTNFATGDLAWIAGRELVKLGTKSGGGAPHTYTSSTRGYLGTARGSTLRKPGDNIHHVWVVGTSVGDVAYYWYNRRVALYAHVPGEAATNCAMVWSGRLRSITDETGTGVTYRLECVSDYLGDVGHVITPMSMEVLQDQQVYEETQWFNEHDSLYLRFLTFKTTNADGRYALAAAYQYRTEPGGTDGMVSGWDADTVQALDDATYGNNILMSFVMCGDVVVRMLRQNDIIASTNRNKVLAEFYSAAGIGMQSGNSGTGPPSNFTGERAYFLLDNWNTAATYSRFAINGRRSLHPIDILLIFMLSTDREMFRADTSAAVHTTTVVNFASVGPADLFIGRALFCVEGANKGEAREITDNDTTSVTVGYGFTNAPSALGNEEYQIRNSIYDLLPINWGLAIDCKRVDIASFETVRDLYLPGEEVAPFVFGGSSKIDIWKTLQEYIIKPYQILIRFDKTTGKLTAGFMGQPVGDGIMESYVAITESDILEAGSISHTFTNPIGRVTMTVRGVSHDQLLNIETYKNVAAITNDNLNRIRGDVPGAIGGPTQDIEVRQTEVEAAFRDDETQEIKISPLFDTVDTSTPLIARWQAVVATYSVPPPVWSCKLDLSLYSQVVPGAWVLVTYNNPAAPPNGYTGTRGWTSVAGRVIGVALNLKEMSLDCQIEMHFQEFNGGRIAPAAVVTSKGNDVDGDYFVVTARTFTNDTDDADSYHFVTGDLITLFDSTGASKESEEIKGFGTTFTTGAASGTNGTRIYVVGTIASAIAAGDYVTLTSWAAGNTARMEQYAALANASAALTGGDDARVYG